MPAVNNHKTLPPFAVRLSPKTMGRIRNIAKANRLSIADVINLSLASGILTVESKLSEIHNGKAA